MRRDLLLALLGHLVLCALARAAKPASRPAAQRGADASPVLLLQHGGGGRLPPRLLGCEDVDRGIELAQDDLRLCVDLFPLAVGEVRRLRGGWLPFAGELCLARRGGGKVGLPYGGELGVEVGDVFILGQHLSVS